MAEAATDLFDLLDLAVEALVAAGTDAGSNVFAPGDLPAWDGTFPYIRARIVAEEKQSLGRNAPAFNVIGTIRLDLVLTGNAATSDSGATNVDVALWRLKRQCEVAVINSGALTEQLQQFPFIRTRDAYTSEGARHVGAMEMDLGLEFFQGVEDFCPVPLIDVERVVITDGADAVRIDQGFGQLDFENSDQSGELAAL